MFRIKNWVVICCIFLTFQTHLIAQKQISGIVTGFIFEKSSDKPLEFAQVILKRAKDSTFVQGAVTDSKGKFLFEKVPAGDYRISYSFIGFGNGKSEPFILSTGQPRMNVGKIYISESTKTITEVEVTGRKSTFVNSIDRKTFNVGEDLMSSTGSLSDLLQNVPSVQVDIDGNVSLRGSENVTILINGKPSAMMNLDRAAVLQQIPANSGFPKI